MRAGPLPTLGSSKDLQGNALKIIGNLWSYIWPKKGTTLPSYKGRVLLALGLLFGGKILTVQVPFLFKEIVNHLSATPEILTVPLGLLLAYGALRVSSAGFQEFRNAIFATVTQKAIRGISRNIFLHLHSMDLAFHLSRQTGALSRVMDRGSRSIDYVMRSLVFNIVPTIFEIGLVSSLLAIKCGWEYSAVALGTVGVYSAYTVLVTQWRNQHRRLMNNLENEASNRAIDSLLNYETIKYFNNEEYEATEYDTALSGYQKAALKIQTSLAMLNFGQNAIFGAGLTALMVMTGFGVASGALTVGDMVLVNGLLFQLSIPLNFIGSVYRDVRQALIDMETLFNLQSLQPGINDAETAQELVVSEGRIDVENVKFSYKEASGAVTPVLDDVSFTVLPGSTVAIVGPSGSGKSTLIRLLFRFMDVDQGSIKVDGCDIRDVTLKSLRSAYGIVPQDTVLFNDTIRHNIHYGSLEASQGAVEEAVRLAQLDAAISGMPEGLDTLVGERGLKLSGGEKQRVAIARTVLKNAPILLCDEPTSSLDSRTETAIMSSLWALSKRKTTLLIAHRLSTIQHADEILVVDKGRVVERGTHRRLMHENGLYTEMWKFQQRQEDEDKREWD